MQDSMIDWKSMNTKILKKTVRFFNMNLAHDIITYGYPKTSEAATHTCITTQLF